jgi:phospholipid-binding lipoprotein MlaA
LTRMRRPTRLPRLALTLALATGLAACATRPDPTDAEAVAEFNETNDPLEPLNRASFFVNDGIDTLVLRPAAEAYRIFVAPEIRTGVRNVLGNLRTPVILLNDLLQGEGYRAGETVGRFVLNTTLGVLGIFDVATDLGLPGHGEDFGQTLAHWGATEGPYLFIPVLGPSNPRDLTGAGVDAVSNPFTWITGNTYFGAATNSRLVLQALDTREGLLEPLDALRAGSLDPYASLRSAYRQRRAAELTNRPGVDSPQDRGTGFGVGPGPNAPGQRR